MTTTPKSDFFFYGIILAVMLSFVWTRFPNWSKGDEVRSVLTTSGYSDIKLIRVTWFDCPDFFGMEFEAKGPTGLPAHGTVCKGIFTDAYVRVKEK